MSNEAAKKATWFAQRLDLKIVLEIKTMIGAH